MGRITIKVLGMNKSSSLHPDEHFINVSMTDGKFSTTDSIYVTKSMELESYIPVAATEKFKEARAYHERMNQIIRLIGREFIINE